MSRMSEDQQKAGTNHREELGSFVKSRLILGIYFRAVTAVPFSIPSITWVSFSVDAHELTRTQPSLLLPIISADWCRCISTYSPSDLSSVVTLSLLPLTRVQPGPV